LLADGSAIPSGDALTPLAGALADPEVAVAGSFGLTSAESGRPRPDTLAPSESSAPGALTWGWIAFRRADFAELGPLDARFVTPAWLDVWLSLRLRAGADPDWIDEEVEPPAEGPGDEAATQSPDPAGQPDLPSPRRAVRLDLPLEGSGRAWPPERTRLNRRNMYRVLSRFGWRPDLF
jgi:hypothetical protein